jgi:hypothetical protein
VKIIQFSGSAVRYYIRAALNELSSSPGFERADPWPCEPHGKARAPVYPGRPISINFRFPELLGARFRGVARRHKCPGPPVISRTTSPGFLGCLLGGFEKGGGRRATLKGKGCDSTCDASRALSPKPRAQFNSAHYILGSARAPRLRKKVRGRERERERERERASSNFQRLSPRSKAPPPTDPPALAQLTPCDDTHFYSNPFMTARPDNKISKFTYFVVEVLTD